LRDADGKELPLPANGASALDALGPGLYSGEAGKELKRFAVNVDPAESRLAPLPTDELERFGAPIDTEEAAKAKEVAQRPRQAAAEIENHKIWRWLIRTLVVCCKPGWRTLTGVTSGQVATISKFKNDWTVANGSGP
jgi:hypothetical protein